MTLEYVKLWRGNPAGLTVEERRRYSLEGNIVLLFFKIFGPVGQLLFIHSRNKKIKVVFNCFCKCSVCNLRFWIHISRSSTGSNSVGEELPQTYGVVHAADFTHCVEYTDWKCSFISFTSSPCCSCCMLQWLASCSLFKVRICWGGGLSYMTVN